MSVKESVLTTLKNNTDGFVSGEFLSQKMDVSRTAIWKAITSLRKEGYSIEAVTNKGYRLVTGNGCITQDALINELPDRYKQLDIHVYDTIDSTNTKAKQLALTGAPHGTVVIAKSQTAGKGRLGRSFYSPKDGIYISIVIKPDFDFTMSGLVTTATAVAVAESIEEICDIKTDIKWVNDVYVDNKKVCGILSEGITDFETGQIESIIIGIGINTSVEGFPKELADIAGAISGEYSAPILAAEVISKTLDLMQDIESRTFIDTYRQKNLVIGKTVTVYKGIYINDPSEVPSSRAKVLGIDENGGLMVLYTDGTRETLTSGEISIRI
ncbi:MAG: biotin--[acetyl-CoA-carboxylase] ligase [Bacillota bacterium]|nr:biotin--[acetyl-CoA-carboxylase] ligase [Bacillota bacterium]